MRKVICCFRHEHLHFQQTNLIQVVLQNLLSYSLFVKISAAQAVNNNRSKFHCFYQSKKMMNNFLPSRIRSRTRNKSSITFTVSFPNSFKARTFLKPLTLGFLISIAV